MCRTYLRRYALGTVTMSALLLAASASLAAPSKPAPTASPVAPPNAKVYGKSLTQWMSAYWTWFYGTGENAAAHASAPYKPGPAPVVLMPQPVGSDATQTGGSWTAQDPAVMVGSINVTLPTGTGFVMPTFAWVAERYQGWPAVADDPVVEGALIFNTIRNQSITLDGKPLLRNWWDYYVPPTYFPQPVEYPAPSSYGSVAAIRFQGVGMVVNPLPPGKHVLHLVETLAITDQEIAIPGYNLGVTYDNTWYITVRPGR